MAYIDFDADPDIFGIDWALWKMGLPSGHSGNGWSHNSAFLQCPRKFQKLKLLEDVKVKGEEPSKLPASKALEIGIIGHLFLELHYRERMLRDGPVPTIAPEEVKNQLLDLNITAEYVGTAWRVFEAYLDQDPFVDDKLFAVELRKEHSTGFTSRMDLVIIRDEKFWLVDHKIISQFSRVNLECWQHSGTVLGQQLTFLASGAVPPEMLGGSIINLLGKQKEPKFEQIPVPYRPEYVDEFRESMERGFAEQKLCELDGRWPKRQSACVGAYGSCKFYEECWT